MLKNPALLVMDYQNDILAMIPSQSATLLKNASQLIEAARRAGAPVIYVEVSFRAGYPEVSSRNKSFTALKGNNRFIQGNPGTNIHPAVAPHESDVVVIKHRVGAFSETELQTILRARGVENLVLTGISSSGVVLSTLRVAADLDYGITVVADACADPDEEVHRVLMEKVFSKQAEVVKTTSALTLFAQ